jgi:hypothetical protein
MLLAGLSGIMVVEIYSAIMQWKFQNTTNTVGKGFAILGIYLFSVIYCELLLRGNNTKVLIKFKDGMINSTTWIYGSEILPNQLRSKVMGLAALGHFVVNVASAFPFTQSALSSALTPCSH